MKLTIKLLYVISLILSLTLTSGFVYAETEMLYSEKGYPYKNLINRSDKVKIIYSEKDASVDCRVEVELQGTTWKSNSLQVKKQDFETAPLSSCLGREKAKQMLASTYAE